MPAKAHDLAVVTVVTLVAVALAVVDAPLLPVRAVVGAPLVLILPGYALLQAAFARQPLQGAEALLGSVAISVGLAVLVGFVLNGTPWGLQPRTWAVALGGVTLAAVVAARQRRRAGDHLASRPVPFRLTWRHGLVFGLAAAVFVAAYGVAFFGSQFSPRPGFTQLWLLPESATQVRVGIRNEEPTAMEYTLQLRADGQPVREWASIALAPGETWEMVVAPSPPDVGGGTVEATLYRANVRGYIYRRAVLQR